MESITLTRIGLGFGGAFAYMGAFLLVLWYALKQSNSKWELRWKK